ncbi:RING finger protein 11 [Phytophthora pseudosyringae]|uniref:RING finger protein 11 n=1 Tax=Phytophthora pseudosyringae TaxID=221518 RepID=A0A8T1WHG2_9STRA|nr:RING finger protein 11 [Phytophthora pseudosyringae]
MASEQQFPESLAWVERGSVLIRRMNSERVAEDPRVRRLLLNLSLPPSPTEVTAMEAIAEENASADDSEEKMPVPPPPPPSLLLGAQESFEAIEAATDADDIKQESENAASNTYKVLLWTYRLQASLQSAVQYALFAKTSEDGCFIQIAPRVYCVAPPHITTFSRLFGAYSSARNWNAAVKVLELLDAQMSKRFEDGACVFDCGLFDGVKRMHLKPLVFDEFCDGRIASISYCRGPIPSMHSGFVVTSTVAAWLDLKPSNVAILLAPNNEQMSVFATCCTLYCTDASSFPENFGNELLSAYLQHIKLAETWPAKLQRTFSGNDPKNAAYTGGLPRPQARYIADFGKLLEMRDRKLVDCADSPALEEKKQKLTGIAVTPATRPIYIRQIDLLSSPDCADDAVSSTPATLSPLADICRPYFVIQNEKGVLFSSMVNGVRDVDLHSGMHLFRVGRQFKNCSDLMIKMYHLPFGRQGELIFESRLHASILLELQVVEGEAGLREEDVGVATLSLEKGDFDCISSTFSLPKQFTVRILYSHDSSAFPAMELPLPIRQMDEISSAGASSAAAAHANGNVAQVSEFAEQQRRDSRAKAMRYDGPSAVTFLLGQSGIRTPFGDLTLEKIDVIRKAHRNHVDIYLLFHVDAGHGQTKVLPLRHLFRFVLPDVIREKVITMGASEESLDENAPSSFDVGAGIMPFDEEYARWLQHLYETDLDTPGNNYDDEFVRGIPVTDIQPSLDYRIVSIETEANEPPPPARDQQGRRPYTTKSRGASASLINQLPTYTFSTSKESDNNGTPDCLICRCSFEVGEEIKSLPCFHSYHSDCVDSWLSLNKVCPVCQFSVDQTQL